MWEEPTTLSGVGTRGGATGRDRQGQRVQTAWEKDGRTRLWGLATSGSSPPGRV